MEAYRRTVQEVCDALEVNPQKGLSEAQVVERQTTYGPNELKGEKIEPLVLKFLSQLKDPMLIMLIAAAVISFVVELMEGGSNPTESIIILFVVLLNAILGVFQESKAEAALEELKKMSAAQSQVMRDGKLITVASRDLVPGDVVHLQAGDSVPADCRVVEAAQLQVEEASLTGESNAVTKTLEALGVARDGMDGEAQEAVALADRTNMVYAGSTVVYGRGVAVVVDTGMQTEMGHIATSLSEAKAESTPLQKKLLEFSKFLTIAVGAICAFIFVVSFIKHGPEALAHPQYLINLFMTAIALAVAAIPEGLAAVVTIVLSLGVTRMSKRNAIIRKLTAVETLGCTQVICSDKTGTLTQNKMSVVAREASDDKELVLGMALCSDAVYNDDEGKATGEPTEMALVEDAAHEGLPTSKLNEAWQRIGEAPFDSERKMMSVVVAAHDDPHTIVQYTKGGLDEILSRCTHILKDGHIRSITEQDKDEILKFNLSMTEKAFRVLALAKRVWDAEPKDYSAENLEQNLCFVGMSCLMDPVRPDVKPSIEEAMRAGMRVVMITGDHINTACAIAEELGLISSKDEAITGTELDRMSDEELAQNITRYGVYARVQPEHKVRIVEAWKKQNQVVAMTGDGVNDAPSIKRADIGIGMGIVGTDVTKSVADMVLADDNFATIVVAAREGRRIYDNIRKAILFLLSSNLAEVVVVFLATMVGFTILQPLQLLWINLLSDTFPAIAFGFEAAEPNIMRRKPRAVTDGIFSQGMAIDIIVQGIIISALTFIGYFIGHAIEYGTFDIANVIADPASGHYGITMAFLTLSFVEMFLSLNMRSQRHSIFTLKTQNFWLWGAFVLSFVLTTVVVEVPALATIFGFANISMFNYLIALGLAFLIIPLVEIYKMIMRKLHK